MFKKFKFLLCGLTGPGFTAQARRPGLAPTGHLDFAACGRCFFLKRGAFLNAARMLVFMGGGGRRKRGFQNGPLRDELSNFQAQLHKIGSQFL
jgi:hypothetical protein